MVHLTLLTLLSLSLGMERFLPEEEDGQDGPHTFLGTELQLPSLRLTCLPQFQ